MTVEGGGDILWRKQNVMRNLTLEMYQVSDIFAFCIVILE
jgi:hypothetical protein